MSFRNICFTGKESYYKKTLKSTSVDIHFSKIYPIAFPAAIYLSFLKDCETECYVIVVPRIILLPKYEEYYTQKCYLYMIISDIKN